jgi:hypothetical protein
MSLGSSEWCVAIVISAWHLVLLVIDCCGNFNLDFLVSSYFSMMIVVCLFVNDDVVARCVCRCWTTDES